MPFKFAPARPCKVQVERWIPDHDDGATFVPGHWAVEGAWDLAGSQQFDFAEEQPGTRLTVWTDPEEEDAPPAAA